MRNLAALLMPCALLAALDTGAGLFARRGACRRGRHV